AAGSDRAGGGSGRAGGGSGRAGGGSGRVAEGSARAAEGAGHGVERPGDPAEGALAEVRRLIERAESTAAPIGAVVVEPIQGRGGVVVSPPGFLAGLRDLCAAHGTVLVFDEIYTGFGRTGRWFACEHEGVVPDIMPVGKALTGMLPLSAAIGSPTVMESWPPSTGEAIHTSTFLGNPISCAAALAQIEEIERRG